MVDRTIRIVVITDGTRRAGDQLRNVGNRATAASQGVNLLRNALALVGGAAVIRQIIRVADEFTALQNRVRIANQGIGDVNTTLDRLRQISNRTRTSLDANVQLFQRASIAANELGASQQELFQFVETVGTALAIQGGSAQTASGALLQLSQAVGSAVVRAEEFNSILEGAFPIALAAARGIDAAGGSVARLRTLIADGQVTSEQFFRAILSQSDDLEEQFGRTVVTLGQAFTVLRNELTNFIGGLNETSGFTRVLAQTVLTLADNLEVAARIVGAAGLTASLLLAVRAVQALTAAIAANPLGLIVVAVTGAISALVTFSDQIGVSGTSLATLRDVGVAAFQVLGEAVAAFINFVRPAFEVAFGAIQSLFGDVDFSLRGIVTTAARVADTVIGVFTGLVNVAVLVADAVFRAFESKFRAIAEVATSIFNFVIETITSVANAAVEAVNFVLRQANRVVSLISDIDIPELGFVNTLRENIGEVITTTTEQVGLATAAVGEAFLEGFNNTPVEDAVNNLFDRAEDIALERTLAATAGGGGGAVAAPGGVGGGRAAVEQSNTLRLLNQALMDVRQSVIDLSEAEIELNRLVAEGSITVMEAEQVFRQLEDAALASSTSIEAGFTRGFRAVQEQIGDFASLTESTVVNAFNSAEDALVSFVTSGDLTLDNFKQTFSSVVDSILQDLLRLLARQALFALLGAFIPGGGGGFGALGGLAGGGGAPGPAGAGTGLTGALGGATGLAGGGGGLFGGQSVFSATGAGNVAGGLFSNLPGFQSGGRLPLGSAVRVGEGGRAEAFVPDTPGRIVSANDIQEMSAASQPVVNVINVRDNEEAEAAAIGGTATFEQSVLNVLRRNPEAVNSNIRT